MNERHIGCRIRILNNLLYRYIQNSECHKHFESVTGTGGYIIAFLDRNRHRAIIQKDLEEEFGITRSTASKVISLMEKKGLIARQSVPGDGRLRQLTLTATAKELTSLMHEDAERTEACLTAGISPEELARFCETLDKMCNNIKKEERNLI